MNAARAFGLVSAAMVAGAFSSAAMSQEVLVDFEDLASDIAGSGQSFITLPTPYAGLDWSGPGWSVGAKVPTCGALPGDCPASVTAFNDNESAGVPVTIRWAGTAGLGFIPLSMDLGSAFDQTFTITGYQGNTAVFSYGPLPVTVQRSPFTLGGTLAFTSIVLTGSHTVPEQRDWVMDNFRYSVAAIPEPSTWALLGAGLACLGVAARRRRG